MRRTYLSTRDVVARPPFPTKSITARLAAMVVLLNLPEMLLAESWPGDGSDRVAAIAGPPLFVLGAIMAWLLAYALVSCRKGLTKSVAICLPIALLIPFGLPGTFDQMGVFILVPMIVLSPFVLIWFVSGLALGYWIIGMAKTQNPGRVAVVGGLVQSAASIVLVKWWIKFLFH